MHTYVVKSGSNNILINASNKAEALKKTLDISLPFARRSGVTVKRYIVDLDNRAIEARRAMGDFNDEFIRKYK